MKKSLYLIVPLVLFLFGCKNEEVRKDANEHSVDKVDSISPKQIKEDSDTSQSKSKVKTEIVSSNTDDNFEPFIPTGYKIKEVVQENSKKYYPRMIALVLSPIGEDEMDSISQINRKLIILEENISNTKIIASSDAVVLCKSCGGVFGDPYNGVTINGDIIRISNYGGSAWRWSENYTFRLQNENLELIGATYLSYWSYANCKEDQDITDGAKQLEDINFATSKMHIVHTKDDQCEPFEDYWKNFQKKKPITLGSFPGKPNQWPGGMIKDGDGKK